MAQNATDLQGHKTYRTKEKDLQEKRPTETKDPQGQKIKGLQTYKDKRPTDLQDKGYRKKDLLYKDLLCNRQGQGQKAYRQDKEYRNKTYRDKRPTEQKTEDLQEKRPTGTKDLQNKEKRTF